MNRLLAISISSVVMLIAVSANANGQWYRGNPRQTIKQLEEDSDRFAKSLDRDLDRSSINGTKLEDEVNGYVHDFEEATDKLRDRSADNNISPGLAREVLMRGQLIDRAMRQYFVGSRSLSDWRRVRRNLDRLAWVYRITWRW